MTNPGMKRSGNHHPNYICGNIVYKPFQRICHAPLVQAAKLDSIAWRAIWRHITQPALLLANARAYYDSLPGSQRAAQLARELAELTGQIERTQRMVRSGAMDEDEGTALILADRQRRAEIQSELRAAGCVLTLPAEHVVAAGMRGISDGAEPDTFDERRPVLEKLVDLKFHYYDGDLEIEGKVPIPDVAEDSKEC
jgi:hypothetical protein